MAILILVFIIVISFEAPVLVKKKMWREMAAFSGYMIIGIVLIFTQALGIKLPNPTKAIEAFIKPISELLK